MELFVRKKSLFAPKDTPFGRIKKTPVDGDDEAEEFVYGKDIFVFGGRKVLDVIENRGVFEQTKAGNDADAQPVEQPPQPAQPAEQPPKGPEKKEPPKEPPKDASKDASKESSEASVTKDDLDYINKRKDIVEKSKDGDAIKQALLDLKNMYTDLADKANQLIDSDEYTNTQKELKETEEELKGDAAKANMAQAARLTEKRDNIKAKLEGLDKEIESLRRRSGEFANKFNELDAFDAKRTAKEKEKEAKENEKAAKKLGEQLEIVDAHNDTAGIIGSSGNQGEPEIEQPQVSVPGKKPDDVIVDEEEGEEKFSSVIFGNEDAPPSGAEYFSYTFPNDVDEKVEKIDVLYGRGESGRTRWIRLPDKDGVAGKDRIMRHLYMNDDAYKTFLSKTKGEDNFYVKVGEGEDSVVLNFKFDRSFSARAPRPVVIRRGSRRNPGAPGSKPAEQPKPANQEPAPAAPPAAQAAAK